MAEFSVPTTEQSGSPKESGTAEGFTATRRIRCAWSDRLVLFSELVGDSVGGVIIGAERYPWNTAARVSKVDIEPFDANNPGDAGDGRTEYDEALLTVTYSIPRPDSVIQDDPSVPLVTEDLSFDREFITLPGQHLYWEALSGGGQGRPLDDDPVLPIALLEWRVTRHNQTVLPTAARTLIDHVNQESMTSSQFGMTFPAGTLLYDSLSMQIRTTREGTELLDPTYIFKYRSIAWNLKLNPRTGNWQSIYLKDETDPYKPFPEGDLLILA